jgi:hypothetical protein
MVTRISRGRTNLTPAAAARRHGFPWRPCWAWASRPPARRGIGRRLRSRGAQAPPDYWMATVTSCWAGAAVDESAAQSFSGGLKVVDVSAGDGPELPIGEEIKVLKSIDNRNPLRT